VRGGTPALTPCSVDYFTLHITPSRLSTICRAIETCALILHMLLIFVACLFKSRSRLEAGNLFLRHQLNIALRRARPRLRSRGGDRVLLVWMVRLWPNLLGMAKAVQRKRSCDGTVQASRRFGAGNREIGQGGRRSITSCAISSDG
jgi:hypothetical protein